MHFSSVHQSIIQLIVNISLSVIRNSFNFDADPDPGSALEKIQVFSLKFTEIFNSIIFKLNFFSFILMPKLDVQFSNQEIFIISLFSIVQIWVWEKTFFSQFLVDIFPGSQNLADPINPDPKHWFLSILLSILLIYPSVFAIILLSIYQTLNLSSLSCFIFFYLSINL